MEIGFKQKSIADALFDTDYQTKIAAENWLNIAGRDFRLIGKTIRIGRALDNDIVVEDRSCSRYHVMITIDGGQIIIEDLKSRNGIRVNGKKLDRATLKDNDIIEVGDLRGVFFQWLKDPTQKHKKIPVKENSKVSRNPQVQNDISSLSLIQKMGLKEKWEALQPKHRLTIIAVAPVFILLAIMLLGGSSEPAVQRQAVTAKIVTLSEDQIVDVVVNKQIFDRCQEYEDLGNFKQSRKCFEALPLNREVFGALNRVLTRQAQLTEKRYLEGDQAFKNYYYDLAIIKWQEVLLIGDEGSDLVQKAQDGIKDAMEKKRLL